MNFEINDIKLNFETQSDLFSPKGLDRGTALLLKDLTKLQYDSLLDWGCGWGAIALFAAQLRPAANITALDSDIAAVKMTRQNVKQNNLKNIEVLASHSFEELPASQSFDVICSNPPTHRGREVVDAMVEQSLARLNPGGHLLLVVETRISPWLKRQLKAVFGDYKILSRGPKNVVLLARKPIKNSV